MDDTERSVRISRRGPRTFTATNPRGGILRFGEGEDAEFSPVELLLVALVGCSAVDVDYITSRRAEPERFEATATARKVADDKGNHLTGVALDFDLVFPDGPDGDRAREILERTLTMSRDRLCTVSRTVQLGTPVAYRLDGREL
jgi:uncharacterized OsmC-like protein